MLRYLQSVLPVQTPLFFFGLVTLWLPGGESADPLFSPAGRRNHPLRDDDVSIDIPNSHLAKSTIVNLYYPSHIYATRVRVAVDNMVPPNDVRDAMSKATDAAPGVLNDPPAKVFPIDFEESAAP
jgi:hypothetical protein